MQREYDVPVTRDLVLIGGGHTHALVLRAWGMNPLAGARLTLINPEATAAYSGMLPGFLAGHYERDALDIDLVRLVRFAGARIIFGSAAGIDRDNRRVQIDGRPDVSYDVLSVDIGIHARMPSLPGFSENAHPAKPLGAFAQAWDAYRNTAGHKSVVVIGGGVAGTEIAMAFAHCIGLQKVPGQVTLIDRGPVLSAVGGQARKTLRHSLDAAGVEVIENAQVVAVDRGGVVLKDRRIDADFVCGAAGAQPYGWLEGTGLQLENGFISVGPDLRSSDPDIFAVGDCAHMHHAPRAKAGVYAVRQAPVLAKNLRAALSGKGRFAAYHPQADYLKLISLGEKKALGERFGQVFSGAWVWAWKNRIDQTFMNKFQNLPVMAGPELPSEHAAGVIEALGDRPTCGGCGSKVGQGGLEAALAGLPTVSRPDIVSTPGDDAAVLRVGNAQQVVSTDHLRAMFDDPVVMTRIAATHALGDIWAMGAKAQAVTANIILPKQSGELANRWLHEIMATAQEIMGQAGAQIVGGHTTFGAELTIGFTITGLCERPPITLAGARAGDAIILTKPIGSGTVFAAEMSGQAKGADVVAAIDAMVQPQARASEVLRDAHAMTDVTGFGLVGHLRNICRASGIGATIDLDRVPLLPGALSLAEAGVRSTLFEQNRAAAPHLVESPGHALMFDPQTAGGLLAAVDKAQAQDVLRELHNEGYAAAKIGVFTGDACQISIV